MEMFMKKILLHRLNVLNVFDNILKFWKVVGIYDCVT